MQKTVITLIFSAILLIGAAVLIITELSSPAPEVVPAEEKTYDAKLFEDYKDAEARNDYIAMNNIFEENMAATGVSFFDTDYDQTHGGVIYTYTFRHSVGDEIVGGKLYIIGADIDRTALSADENDYIAADYRKNNDPEFVVYDSHRAKSEALITALCEMLLSHEEKYPSAWERSLGSMVDEWQIHNAAYAMDYKTDSARDVNLNNADESIDWLERAAKEFIK